MGSLSVDTVTIGSATLTILGLYATFVSSKPVSVASILMIVILSASTTQAMIGFMRAWDRPESNSGRPERDTDVVDFLGKFASYTGFQGFA